MRVLLLVPAHYGLFTSLEQAFIHLGAEVYPADHQDTVKKWETFVNTQIFRAPDKIRLKWESYYFRKVNQYYQEIFQRVRPNLIFVYNNAMLHPETLDFFKKKARVVFFLGDNPFYTPTNRYFLRLLFQADAIFAPDTFWISQLAKLGLKNINYLLPGIPDTRYYKKELPASLQNELQSEVLYVGTCYPNTWGYKKALFLSHFTDFDLQIHGNRHWKRWFPFFPELEPHFRQKTGYISQERINDMYNATRIIPIDGNPGVLHGLHFRMMEALGAGALPLMEWHQDLAVVFGEDADLPAVKSYCEIGEIADYFLKNEAERIAKVNWMREVVKENHSVENNAALILEKLDLGEPNPTGYYPPKG